MKINWIVKQQEMKNRISWRKIFSQIHEKPLSWLTVLFYVFMFNFMNIFCNLFESIFIWIRFENLSKKKKINGKYWLKILYVFMFSMVMNVKFLNFKNSQKIMKNMWFYCKKNCDCFFRDGIFFSVGLREIWKLFALKASQKWAS